MIRTKQKQRRISQADIAELNGTNRRRCTRFVGRDKGQMDATVSQQRTHQHMWRTLLANNISAYTWRKAWQLGGAACPPPSSSPTHFLPLLPQKAINFQLFPSLDSHMDNPSARRVFGSRAGRGVGQDSEGRGEGRRESDGAQHLATAIQQRHTCGVGPTSR